MKKLTNYLFFFSIMFYVCFNHMFKSDTWLFILLGVSAFLFFSFCGFWLEKSYFTKYHLIWSMMLADMLVSILLAENYIDGLKFFTVFTFFVICSFILSQKSNWIDSFVKFLCFGLGAHLIFTYFQVFFTQRALSITEKILPREAQSMTVRWTLEDMHPKVYAGMSGQVGTNAYFFSVLIGILVAGLLARQSKIDKKEVMFLLFAVGALLLTGKKGLILTDLIAVSYILLLHGIIKKRKGYFVAVLTFFEISLVIMQVLVLFKDTLMEHLFSNSVSSRLLIYRGMLDAITRHPIIGNGLNSTGKFTTGEHLGHNIYLQMLCEQGMIGLILLLVGFGVCLYIHSVKLKKHSLELLQEERRFVYFGIYIQVFMITYGMTGNPFYDYYIVFVYFITMAGIEAVFHSNRRRYQCAPEEGFIQ